MTFSVESQIALLQVLKSAPPKLKKAILKNCDEKLLDALSEICFNYLKGNVKCKDNHLKNLKKFKSTVRKLGRSDKRKSDRRKILLQSGGGFITALLAPVVAELVTHFIPL
jgi:hypothetical protein